MGLSIELFYQPQRCGDNKMCVIYDDVVWERSITHNLNKMAQKAGLYEVMWYPDKLEIKTANQAIKYLEKGLKYLKQNKNQLKKYEPENGWGTYDNLVEFVAEYLSNCRQYPDSQIYITR